MKNFPETIKSFSVRCIFKWSPRADQKSVNLYEERITLWKANSFEKAIEFAEIEAAEYSDETCEYINFCQAYEMFETVDAHGIEIFSLLRESNLGADQYLNTFFDSGLERENKTATN